jgi:hypothetical protein
LDLPRCYSSDEFTQSLQQCRDLSVTSEQQQKAMIEMIRYLIELIKAHGNKLRCDILANGEFVDVQLDYQPIFVEASTSLKRVSELTQTVRRPLITQPFQFKPSPIRER